MIVCELGPLDNVYSAVIMAEPLLEFTLFTWWIQNSARWLPTFATSQPSTFIDWTGKLLQ